MSPEDLNELGGLITTVVTQRQVVPFNAGIGLLKWHLEMMFGTVSETELQEGDGAGNQQGAVIRVFDTIDVKKLTSSPNQVTLEWIGNAMNDMVADSVLAVLLSIDSSPASVKASSQPCSHSHGSPKSKEEEALEKAEELDKEFLDIASFLEAQFGPVKLNEKEKTILVNMDGIDATVDTIKFVSLVLNPIHTMLTLV
jgi:cleavage and polyadenylation specificity factor subunit 3